MCVSVNGEKSTFLQSLMITVQLYQFDQPNHSLLVSSSSIHSCKGTLSSAIRRTFVHLLSTAFPSFSLTRELLSRSALMVENERGRRNSSSTKRD